MQRIDGAGLLHPLRAARSDHFSYQFSPTLSRTCSESPGRRDVTRCLLPSRLPVPPTPFRLFYNTLPTPGFLPFSTTPSAALFQPHLPLRPVSRFNFHLRSRLSSLLPTTRTEGEHGTAHTHVRVFPLVFLPFFFTLMAVATLAAEAEAERPRPRDNRCPKLNKSNRE